MKEIEEKCTQKYFEWRRDGVLNRKEIDMWLFRKNLFSEGQHNRLEELRNLLQQKPPKRTLTFFHDKDWVMNQVLFETLCGTHEVLWGRETKLFQEDVRYPEYYQEMKSLVSILNKYYQHSLESLLQNHRIQLMALICIGRVNHQPLWSSVQQMNQEINMSGMTLLLIRLTEFLGGFSSKIMRMVARDTSWHTRWIAASKTGSDLFPRSIIDWNVNQLSLCYWSMFYDNLLQNPDFPGGKFTEDDELVDSWLETERQKYKKKELPSGEFQRGKKVGAGSSSDEHKFVFRR